MSFADLVIPTETIPVGNTKVTVRGLGFNDFITLFNEHGGKVDDLIDATKKGLNIEPNMIMTKFPQVIDLAIALAADEPDQVGKVKMLAAGIKSKIAIKVWDLTLKESGTLEQLMGEVYAALKMTTSGLTAANNLLKNTGS